MNSDAVIAKRPKERFVYFTGPHIPASGDVRQVAMEAGKLRAEGRVMLVLRRCESPTANGRRNPKSGVGSFDYIAIGL